MASPSKRIAKSDVKKWLGMVAIGALAGAIDVLAINVIPDIKDLGGTTNGMIVIGLTLAVDAVRRFLQDTRVVDEDEVDKLVVRRGKEKIALKDRNNVSQ